MNKAKETAILSVGIFAFVDIVFSVLSFAKIISFKEFFSIFIASLIAIINLLLAVFSIKKELKNNKNVIFGLFYKLMAPRIILMLALIIISLKFLDIYRNSFIFSTLIFYIFCQIIEIKLLIGGKY
ncbi:MAG: ATP synthase subunit I [Ignavibacteriaceae bacterium]